MDTKEIRVCARCKHEIQGNDIHLALPDGFKRLCAIVTNLLGTEK